VLFIHQRKKEELVALRLKAARLEKENVPQVVTDTSLSDPDPAAAKSEITADPETLKNKDNASEHGGSWKSRSELDQEDDEGDPGASSATPASSASAAGLVSLRSAICPAAIVNGLSGCWSSMFCICLYHAGGTQGKVSVGIAVS